MKKLQGIAVSPGVAIGEAMVMDTEGFRIPRRFVTRDTVEYELERLQQAIEAASEEIADNRDAISGELGEKYGAIFEAHLQILKGTQLREELEELIRERHYSPEYAVCRVMRRYVEVFQKVQSRNLGDIADIEKRLLRQLLGRRREELSRLTSPVLVLAHNLTPSETANLDRRFVRGFVTEVGGPGSHTAIVAEALEIPAVVGTGPFLADVSGGDLVIIDGDKGWVIIHPDEETIARYRHEAEEIRSMAVRLEVLRDLPAETADHVRVQLMGNIEFPYEVDHCVDRGADGVGLYRTEFLYLGAERDPDEDDHFEAYSRVVQSMGAKPVTIRTFDLGADKVPALPGPEDERNPALGQRSIRLSLRHVPMFRNQLRAILRASALGNVQIMFPLISTILELRQAKMILADVMEDLDEHGVPFSRDLRVGIMVEVPAVVMMIDHFVEEVDFLSIGTNDLIQYTLAVDRSNKDVVWLYNASDPAVLKLIDMTVRAAAKQPSVGVNLCGQMSGNPMYTMLLLGIGLRQLSVPPSAIPEIKRVCRSVTIQDCEAVARHALILENARDVTSYLRGELKKRLPEFGA
jgi:phosphotransferase system enzyme I (PtsI)